MRKEIKQTEIVAIVDSREQLPYDLAPMQQETGRLHVGDYSVKKMESVIAVERKSLQDFVACCGRERQRFQRELDALRGWPVSAVVVEASWETIESGQWRSKIKPESVMGSIASWIAQGHRIILGGDRKTSQRIVRSILFHAARHRWRQSFEFCKQVQRNREAIA